MRMLPLLLLSLLWSCVEQTPSGFPQAESQSTAIPSTPTITLSKAQYHDQILGCLVGSAIGDAMGSPVEMWSREGIADRYGFIDGLILNQRLASAEGPWQSNMVAGTSTDDTRWKYLMGHYFLSLPNGHEPTAKTFAHYISGVYETLKKELISEAGLRPEKLEESTRYLQWLQEWVKVADAYTSGDIDQYATAAAQFYGGEMSCAGMLYAPLLGILYPTDAATAYKTAWNHSLFDLGYAKDISALTAALTASAFDPQITTDSLLAIHYLIDNQNYTDSRLIGRIATGIYEQATATQRAWQKKQSNALPLKAPPAYFKNDSLRYTQLNYFYQEMDPHLKAISFHANEIYRITLNALLYAEGDFMDAMVFVTNYGRDNDTAGAVVGAIMGAQLGFQQLPKNIREQVLKANKEQLNLDLEELARQLSDRFYQNDWAATPQ